jgi:hypothetical protein
MTSPATGLYDHIATLLDTLGDEPGAVAANLRNDDVRGMRGSALAHPVCRWLIRLVPDLAVVLGLDNVHVFRPGRGSSVQGVTVPMPAPVQAFVDRFDDGQYPELELWLGPPLPPADEVSPVKLVPKQPADTMQLPVVAARASAVVVDREAVGNRAGLAGEYVPSRDLVRLERPVTGHRNLTLHQPRPAGGADPTAAGVR